MDATARLGNPHSEIRYRQAKGRLIGHPFVGARPHRVKRPIRWAFYLLIFSFPFEMPNLGLPLEVTTLTGTLFLVTTLLQPDICFRRPPRAFWWFVVYFYIYTLVSLFYITAHTREAVKLFLLLVQLILLCWTGSNLLREEPNARMALLILITGCTALALFQLLGIASSAVEVGSYVQRYTVLGQNPNAIARMFVMGLLALVGLSFGRKKQALWLSAIVVLLFALLLFALADTGSRGSFIALGVGLLTVMASGKTHWQKIRNLFVALLAISFCLWVSYQSETMRVRFETTLDEGSLAQREVIFPAAWQLFLDSPLIGWGPVNNTWELGSRVGEPDHPSRDTHNLGLELLTATGILGAIPFFIGICCCVYLAWNARAGPQGILPFAMITAMIVSNMGANLLHGKLLWFVLSYALASGGHLAATRRRPVLIGARLRPIHASAERNQAGREPLYPHPNYSRGGSALITRAVKPGSRTNE